MLPREKLDALVLRYKEIDVALCEPDVLADYQKMQKLNKERSDLEPVVRAWEQHGKLQQRLEEDRAALSDPELRELVEAELPELERQIDALAQQLRLLLLPTDPNDKRNTIVEVRGGEGGEEAALFAADLFRMYVRFAETHKWKIEIMSLSEASAGGYKEVIALVSGQDVYSRLRYEAGVHRVQRVPVTEAQGRIHTSTATVAVLPEAEDVEVQVEDKDLKIDIAASGGPGGQGVNTTYSAVRVTHLPTRIVVSCQNERSQIKNLASAMKVLRSRLYQMKLEEKEKEIAALESGKKDIAWGSQIRSYVFHPYNMAKDHRTNYETSNIQAMMDGQLLDDFIEAYLRMQMKAPAAAEK